MWRNGRRGGLKIHCPNKTCRFESDHWHQYRELKMDKYMKLAIEEARLGIHNNEGGPFGSIIVKDGKIIGRGHNQVVKENDPTCHGEMQAIRNACKNIKSFDLTGSVIYTTAEPCPMCLGAILWANIDHVYYGCNIKDTDNIGFRDDVFYNKMKNTSHFINELDRDECLKLYEEYNNIKTKVNY